MQQTSMQKTKKNQKKIGGMNMFKKMKHIKNEKGLTLIELLAVIVILAIIAAIAIPAIGNIINNTRDKAVLSDVQSAVASAKIAKADGSCDAPVTTAGVVTVTCPDGSFEFKSGKLTTTSVVFNETADTVTATTTLAKGLSGKKIPDLIDDTAGATLTDAGVLTITDAALNTILGGN